MSCSKDEGRLLSIESCEELSGLGVDLGYRNPGSLANFWVGLFAGGLQSHSSAWRASDMEAIDSRGRSAIRPGETEVRMENIYCANDLFVAGWLQS